MRLPVILLFVILSLSQSCTQFVNPNKLTYTVSDFTIENDMKSKLLGLDKIFISGLMISSLENEKVCKLGSRYYFERFENLSNLHVHSIKHSSLNTPTNIGKLLKQVNTDYYFTQKCQLLSIDRSQGNSSFELKFETNYFDTDNYKVVASNSFLFEYPVIDDSNEELDLFITRHFPKRAFVISSIGSKKFAKISVGLEDKVVPGQLVQFRQTDVKIVGGTENSDQIESISVTYGSEIIGTSKIVFVEENFSWVDLDENFANKVIPGTSVLLYVEP